MSFDVTTLALAKSYTDQHGGGGGASTASEVSYTNESLEGAQNVKTALDALVPKSHIHANKDALDKLSVSNGILTYDGKSVDGSKDFIIQMAVNDANELVSCDTTFGQVDAAYKAGKNPIVQATVSTSDGDMDYLLPLIAAAPNEAYVFGLINYMSTVYVTVISPDIDPDSEWDYAERDFGKDLTYLFKESHIHNNKDTLDKLSDSNGRLRYNGSDIGLKGEKGDKGDPGAPGKDGKDGTNGITPTIGDNGNWYIGGTDTGKPSRGVAGARGDKGAAGKSAYQYAQDGGYTGTETEFAEKLASGALTVEITENNGTLSADKTYIEIRDAYSAGTPVYVWYNGFAYPVIAAEADSIAFGTIACENDGIDAAVGTLIIKITQYGEVNDLSAYVEIPKILPNPHAITFTGAVTGSYDGSAEMTVNIPSAVTDDHINSLIDIKLGVIENGSY